MLGALPLTESLISLYAATPTILDTRTRGLFSRRDSQSCAAVPYLAINASVAIVTGAAGAIGGAVAEQLLRNGASVCICDIGGDAQIMGGEMRDGTAALEQRRDELAAATGGDVMCAVCDVTNIEQIEAMMRKVEVRHGRLDILANVAGV